MLGQGVQPTDSWAKTQTWDDDVIENHLETLGRTKGGPLSQMFRHNNLVTLVCHFECSSFGKQANSIRTKYLLRNIILETETQGPTVCRDLK